MPQDASVPFVEAERAELERVVGALARWPRLSQLLRYMGEKLALMKQAGFTMVRTGGLSWDAFEPSEGQFKFAWFDKILDQMNQAGIKVILDIGGSPAPIWLHRKYPSVNMVDERGATNNSSSSPGWSNPGANRVQ